MAVTKTKLAKCIHHRVRLRPPARRFRGVTELRIMDDDWLVQETEDEQVRIRNIRTDHVAVLAFNQIREYVTDPKREFDGLRHGFLELKVQVFLRGPELVIEPRPSAAKVPAPKKTGAARKRKTS
ncbi:MAG: hypothetical protein JWN94_144 [Betaproteobacteria bacterium]|nr:hypothetical protein [Betaproteobacteria bacterium]